MSSGKGTGIAGKVLATFAALLLGAHFLRAGWWPLVALAAVLAVLPCLRHPLAARILPWALAVGALEWLRTGAMLGMQRAALGQPYLRMLLILGAVAALTLLAAWLVRAGRAARD